MEIRIYVEGGGDQRSGKAAFQRGISRFLDPIRVMARGKKVSFEVIACGGRGSTIDNFNTALRLHSGAINILLVDAEGPIRHPNPWEHLRRCESTWNIPQIPDTHCYLMTQAMEAWVIADVKTLQAYYGQGFHTHSLPNNPDVEAVPKERLERSLLNATRNTTKGEYHKIRHGPEILARADHTVICGRASHCKRLFDSLLAMIATA